jgi:hypothetical protein
LQAKAARRTVARTRAPDFIHTHQSLVGTVSTWDIYADLVEDAAIIRIQAALVEEEAFLHYNTISALDSSLTHNTSVFSSILHVHLLKPLTGVEISARSVRRSGNAGNATTKRSLRAAAEAKRMVLGCSL